MVSAGISALTLTLSLTVVSAGLSALLLSADYRNATLTPTLTLTLTPTLTLTLPESVPESGACCGLSALVTVNKGKHTTAARAFECAGRHLAATFGPGGTS